MINQSDQAALLQVQGLSCVRGDRCLFSKLDFPLSRGELLYVHGHNGCGKTTLLRALCGLVLPDEGDILWQGESIRRLREDYTREVLYLGHLNGIKGDLTGVENLRISAALDGHGVTENEAWNALERIGLHGHEDLPTRVLSQGQKRRVGLARLLINRSPLWILDEPFSALDVGAVELLQLVIREHLEKGGMVILTTHQEVELITDNVRQLKLGWRDV